MTPRGIYMSRGSIVFIAGFAAALAAGWLVFPRVLYTKQAQPFQFRHQTHAAKSGTSQCTDCHVLREDGEFAGIPSVESCATCHADPMGTSKDEAILVNNFVKQHRETPWLIYAKQPANVRFSHAIHTKRAKLECKACHGGQGETDSLRPYEVNRISGYSRDIWGDSISRLRHTDHPGMRMNDCVACHSQHNFEVGCLGCHQ
jgi:menaquinone reductase, multiheme cytochrome c subunit